MLRFISLNALLINCSKNSSTTCMNLGHPLFDAFFMLYNMFPQCVLAAILIKLLKIRSDTLYIRHWPILYILMFYCIADKSRHYSVSFYCHLPFVYVNIVKLSHKVYDLLVFIFNKQQVHVSTTRTRIACSISLILRANKELHWFELKYICLYHVHRFIAGETYNTS